MIHAILLIAAVAGLALLALAMPRHQREWLGHALPLPLSRRLRDAGALLLAVALGISWAGFGGGYGTILWLGWSTISVLTVAVACAVRRSHQEKAR